MELSPKTIQELSPDSPLFYDLWPYIIQAMDDEDDFLNLALTCTYFHSIAKPILLQFKSDRVKKEYVAILGDERRSTVNPLRIDSTQTGPLWYSWGVEGAGFFTLDKFHEFCEIAGIEHPHKEPWGAKNGGPAHNLIFSFLSTDGDFSMHSACDPRDPQMRHYTGRIGCTGLYTKTKQLQEWFVVHGYYDEMCSGKREYF